MGERGGRRRRGLRPGALVTMTCGGGLVSELPSASDLLSHPFPAGVQALLVSLEGSYYSSQHRGRLVTTGASQELQELCQLAAQCQQTNK